MRAAVLTAGFLLASVAAAEPLRFVDLEGAEVTLGPPAPGEALVLHFWATWCPTCGPELAVIERAAAACADSPVRVVAVDVGEPADEVRRAVAERGLALPILLDPRGRAWRREGGREVPSNLVWTPDQRQVSFGPSDEATWRARLAELGCSGVAGAR